MTTNTQNGSKPILTDKQYELLRGLVQYVLPAVGTLYSALAILWGFGYAEQVVGTCAALATFGGVILGLSKSRYNKSEEKYDGQLVVTRDESGKPNILGVVGKGPLETLAGKGEATLRVVSPSEATSQN